MKKYYKKSTKTNLICWFYYLCITALCDSLQCFWHYCYGLLNLLQIKISPIFLSLQQQAIEIIKKICGVPFKQIKGKSMVL